MLLHGKLLTKINTDAKNVFLIGRNGQGKTNFIESIYCLCYGSSFRTNLSDKIINIKSSEALLEGLVVDREDFEKKISLKMGEKKKDIRIDDNLMSRKDIFLNLPCVVFSYEDINFVKGSPEKKRKFLNQLGCYYSKSYLKELRDYNNVLKNKHKFISK